MEILNNISTELQHRTNEIYDISYICEGDLYSMDALKTKDDTAVKNGKEAVLDTMESHNNQKSALIASYSSYDRLGARDYALNNFYDHAGEYTNNCANFVSYCLNEGGGLPQTTTWSPGTNNWVRTGYNVVDGVCIYVNNYENFAWTSNRSITNAGCIVFWNAYSHVGLTTYGDGSVIKFSAHTTDR